MADKTIILKIDEKTWRKIINIVKKHKYKNVNEYIKTLLKANIKEENKWKVFEKPILRFKEYPKFKRETIYNEMLHRY